MEKLEFKKKVLQQLVEERINWKWNEERWNEIFTYLKTEIEKWNATGTVTKGVIPYICDMVNEFCVANDYLDEKSNEKMLAAGMDLLEMMYDLYDEEDESLKDL